MHLGNMAEFLNWMECF